MSVTTCLTAAAVAGGLAAAGLAASRVDLGVARAQARLATFEFEAAGGAYAALERDLSIAGAAPWPFGRRRADADTRRAALRYWRGEYAALLAEHADAASSAGAAPNLPLQFILASAAARAALDPAADRAQVLRALDGAIDVYRGVLQASPEGHPDAAYNYEYLIRLRADLASGVPMPTSRRSQHGREGDAPADAELEEIRIYVPVQRDVDPEIDESPTLGAGGQIRKRG